MEVRKKPRKPRREWWDCPASTDKADISHSNPQVSTRQPVVASKRWFAELLNPLWMVSDTRSIDGFAYFSLSRAALTILRCPGKGIGSHEGFDRGTCCFL